MNIQLTQLDPISTKIEHSHKKVRKSETTA
jgi:hypothetical protein